MLYNVHRVQETFLQYLIFFQQFLIYFEALASLAISISLLYFLFSAILKNKLTIYNIEFISLFQTFEKKNKNNLLIMNLENLRDKTAKILLDIKSINFQTQKNPLNLHLAELSPVYVDCRKIISHLKERRSIINMTI